ncbi:hypothetical protein KIN20_015175 [Parelaphostrongylus tenuis]|uniref:PiggyBac transposable element-derived protein domain-containing protein n=1 Tax=Parelaphostrongylus tenuis TaxID=148309 RepID=A0AAD5MJ53_PARTN|nr:hypothetical protein KIN20_015166 [Parelaphostrongylus tenuis]KAJ1357123.1 hypothetical protein KIN20_015175 [Parelaphostrongylus tenuis]
MTHSPISMHRCEANVEKRPVTVHTRLTSPWPHEEPLGRLDKKTEKLAPPYRLEMKTGKSCGGTTDTPTDSVADGVVMDLTEELPNEGRHLCTDSWYISVSLAETLLQKDTYLTGTRGKNS